MIRIAIDIGSNKYCWRKLLLFSSSCKQFEEHHIGMVSCVHRKCQTRDGVSGDVNKMLECVTIIHSKFSNRVLQV